MVELKWKRVGINRGVRYGSVFDSAHRAGLFEAEEVTDNQANLKKLIMGVWMACRIPDAIIHGTDTR